MMRIVYRRKSLNFKSQNLLTTRKPSQYGKGFQCSQASLPFLPLPDLPLAGAHIGADGANPAF